MLGTSITDLHESDAHSSASSYPRGNTPGSRLPTRDVRHALQLSHLVPPLRGCSVQLCLQCHHWKPGLAKFMVVPHYKYIMLKMLGPQGIITMKADFLASVECYRGAIQSALTYSTLVV